MTEHPGKTSFHRPATPALSGHDFVAGRPLPGPVLILDKDTARAASVTALR
jgi:hypothetical protein